MNTASYEEYLSRGLEALKRGNPKEALSWLQAASEQSSDVRIWSALGAAHWRLGDKSRGLNAFMMAAQVSPNDGATHFNLAVALAESGRLPEAKEEARKTLELDPDHAGARRLSGALEEARSASGGSHPVTGATLLNPDSVSVSPPEFLLDLEPAALPYRPGRPESRSSEGPAYGGSRSVGLPDFDQVPWATLAIIGLNCLVFWMMERAGGSTDREVMIAYGSQFRPLVLAGQWWRLVTAMFIHAGGEHIFFNMLFFALSARWVEPFYGRARFLLLYMAAGFVGNWMTLLLMNSPTAGASGAVLGVIAARIVMGFKYRDAIPANLRGKFGWWPLLFSLWIIYSGFHNPQTNNVAHVAGFAVGLLLAATLAPSYKLDSEWTGVRVPVLGMAAVALYTVLGMAWSVHKGVDESGDILRARAKLAEGKIAVRLAPYQDLKMNYDLKVPVGWQRQDEVQDDQRLHRWSSPMMDASILFLTYPVPEGQGGEQAMGIERSLVDLGQEGAKEIRTLSQEKRVLSGRVGGRIILEGRDRKGEAHRLYYYFVPIHDTLYILIGVADRYHAPKYAPIFDTIAASFKAYE